MSDPWYSPLDGLPPYNFQVRVQWRGRVFEASLIKHPNRGGDAWLTASDWITRVDVVDGVPTSRKTERRSRPMPIILPDHGLDGIPESGPMALGPHPDAWQPLVASKWERPLPPPIKSIEPQMWSSRTKFAAVDDADAADLAREMERDREMAQTSNKGDTIEIGGIRLPWWRDATLVTYSQPGAISVSEAEARVSRAILSDGIRCRTEHVLEERTSTALQDLVAAAFDAEVATITEWLLRFNSLPQDRADEEIAMLWFAKINPPELHSRGRRPAEHFTREQRVLVWRALSRGWRDIGEDLCCSDTQAKRIFGGALDQVWRAANGWPVFDHVTVQNQLAALKARNRQARHMEGV